MKKALEIHDKEYDSSLVTFMKDYQKCSKHYSHALFQKVVENEYFTLIFKLFYLILNKNKCNRSVSANEGKYYKLNIFLVDREASSES